MSADVQFGAAAASVYDSLIGEALPAGETLDRLRDHLCDARVLEVGVGTGRVAIPAAELARELVGIDHSPSMLDVLRSKPLPANLTIVEADYRAPLPFRCEFDAAYSVLGSVAYVSSRDELTRVLSHVARVLRPGAVFALDYYATAAYRPLVELHTVTLPAADGDTTFTVTLDGADRMTMVTRMEIGGREPIEFAERILLIESAEVLACLAAAGFDVKHVDASDGGQPYDWYVARRSGQAGGGAAC